VAAKELAGRLTGDSINRELSKLGCPQQLCSRLPKMLLTHQPLHQNYLPQIQVLVPLRRRWHPVLPSFSLPFL
jgi:hypothetical protein